MKKIYGIPGAAEFLKTSKMTIWRRLQPENKLGFPRPVWFIDIGAKKVPVWTEEQLKTVEIQEDMKRPKNLNSVTKSNTA